MEALPTEVLERILRCPAVSHTDLLAFSQTSRRFSSVASSNDVWREKFRARCGRLYAKVTSLAASRPRQEIAWKPELQRRLETGARVAVAVAEMSPRLFLHTELSFSDLSWCDDLLLQHHPARSFLHLYLVDSLQELLARGGREEGLTTKYYSARALCHTQHRLLRGQLEGPGGEAPGSCEEALVVVAQWCQPTLDLQAGEVAASLDSLAVKVLEQLLPGHPDLAVFRHIARQQEDSSQPLPCQLPKLPVEMRDSLWPPEESRAILLAANHVLYEVEGLAGNAEDYSNPDNSYINKVLESGRGIPISLSLLYCAVLQRLGVVLLPVNIPGHFLIKWLEWPEQSAEARFTYVDCFEAGKQLSYGQVRARLPHLVTQQDSYQVASPQECCRRMLRNLISIGASRSNNMRDGSYSLLRNSLELMMIVNTADSLQYAFMLSRIYLQLNINHEEVLGLLADQRDNPGLADQVDYLMHQCQLQMEDRDREKQEPLPKKRGVAASFPNGEVRHWVGQVCRHTKYNYTCVVYGWDPVCTASQSWISHMGVDKLRDRDRQPFYNVLVGDGSQRYAAQENLAGLDQACPVPHPEVGRYFSSFCPKLGYLPNQELRAQYPDEEQLQRTLATPLSSS